MEAAKRLLVLAALALSSTTAAPTPEVTATPQLSLKHDTDVVRMARPNHRQMLLVDLIRPPPSTADPLLTNEVDTSADGDLPRLVRVLIPDPSGADDDDYQPRPAPADTTGLDAVLAEMTKLLPPLPAQPAPAGDWGAPNGDLVPPPEGLASEWTKQDAQPRADSGVVSEPQEPSDELQPPSVSATGVWELFEGIKMAQADEAAAAASETREATAVVGEPATELLPPPVDTVNFWTNRKAEARSDDAAVEDKESPAEPATDLVPPPVGEADVSAWTKQETAAASDAAPAKASAPAAGRADEVPEPASFLVPPQQDSYMPDTPSSGEAHADDFLSLGAAPPPSDAAVEFIKEHSDSYLPGAGELKALSEGPVVDDFLAIGEPPKEDAETTVPRKDIAPEELAKEEEAVKDTKTDSKEDGKDSYMPQTDSKEDARDSYMPQTDSKEDARDSYMPQTDSKEDARDSYTPDEASSSSSREDADDIGLVAPAKEQPSAEKATDGVSAEVHEHSHEHADDEVHATTPATEDADDDVDGDGAKASGSGDLRKKRHICKVCGGGGGGFGGGLPSVSIVINKQPAYGGGYGGYGGGGGGYCDVCGRPVYHQPPPPPPPRVIYKPVPVPVYQQPVCNSCNQPPPPPPCNTCGGGGGGDSYSYSQSQSSSSSSSYSSGWGK